MELPLPTDDYYRMRYTRTLCQVTKLEKMGGQYFATGILEGKKMQVNAKMIEPAFRICMN